jgi:hypothetical protein
MSDNHPKKGDNLETTTAQAPTTDGRQPPKAKEPELPKPPQRKNAAKDPEPGPYNNPQIQRFQKFVSNTPAERERLSNSIDIWDSTPRYSVSRQEMNKRRNEYGGLPLLTLGFSYRSQDYIAKIQPAKIEEDGKTVEYYPSANEELVEEALRKLAARQHQGFHEQAPVRSGVAFSLYELRQELSEQGHARSYQQITQSLTILRRSHIEIRKADGKGEVLVAANYLPSMAAVSREQIDENPDARWVAQFHPLVSRSIDQLAYRQFNYAALMALPTQLARWLHKQLSIKFTFASMLGNPFEMHYSTIKRDSNMLNRGRERDNRGDVDDAFVELVKNQVLREVQKRDVIEGKGKVVDVIYYLYPTPEFVKEMKAANKR